ncbi:MAG TPA: amino acid--tRNA ligase-related protein, partial [Chthonomonadales bacterium]|nr:amino acid--tRNA ligase-related protein [Chthonomonadales bacterium]
MSDQPLSEIGYQSAARLEKLNKLRNSGSDPFTIERYERTDSAASAASEERWPSSEGRAVSLAGRLASVRLMGKAAFADLRDASGRIQFYVRREEIGDAAYDRFKDLDAGDIIGIRGKLFRTRTGEISVHGEEVLLLAKALKPVPLGKVDESGVSHSSLADQEVRYRKRYLDLIANPASQEMLAMRCRLPGAIRRFLDERGFVEVETPILQDIAGGASARPFVTHHNALDHEFKLRISLELYLKRLIIGGFERVYEIGRVFRNEGISTRHSPEFTMMELYQAYANLEDIMELVESLYAYVAEAVTGSATIRCQNREVDLARRPWRRLPMLQGIQEYAGIAPESLTSLETARDASRAAGVTFDLAKEHTLGGLI